MLLKPEQRFLPLVFDNFNPQLNVSHYENNKANQLNPVLPSSALCGSSRRHIVLFQDDGRRPG